MAGPVGPGNARAVENECHGQFQQCDIHQHLVEGSVEKRRIDGDHRMHAAECQPRCGCNSVLLRDPHIEHPVGKLLSERRQTGRPRHRGGDRDDVVAAAAPSEQLTGKDVRPLRNIGVGLRFASSTINRSACMHAISRIFLRRAVSHSLAGDRVDDNRATHALCRPQGLLER